MSQAACMLNVMKDNCTSRCSKLRFQHHWHYHNNMDSTVIGSMHDDHTITRFTLPQTQSVSWSLTRLVNVLLGFRLCCRDAIPLCVFMQQKQEPLSHAYACNQRCIFFSCYIQIIKAFDVPDLTRIRILVGTVARRGITA